MIIEHETSAQSSLIEAKQTADKIHPWLLGIAEGGVIEALILTLSVTGTENAGLLLLSAASVSITGATIFRSEYLSSRVRMFQNLYNSQRLQHSGSL